MVSWRGKQLETTFWLYQFPFLGNQLHPEPGQEDPGSGAHLRARPPTPVPLRSTCWHNANFWKLKW